MTDVVEKMAVAHFAAEMGCSPDGVHINEDGLRAMRAALDALAERVTLEMGVALERALSEGDGGRDLSGNYKLRAIRAAILAAKG